MIDTFTEIDFYKAKENLLYKVIQITRNQVPHVNGKGEVSYPVDDGGLAKVHGDINCLERALSILKQQNS